MPAVAMDVEPAPPAAQCEQEHEAAAAAGVGVEGWDNLDQEAAEVVLDGRIL